MFGFLQRLFSPPEPPQPRLSARVTELENQYDDIDSRVAWLAKELKKVAGRQYAMEKYLQPAEADQENEGTESGNGSAPLSAPFSTAHLAARFRRG